MPEFTPEPISMEDIYYDYVKHENGTDQITVDKLLDQMDLVYNTTAEKRNKLISKLMKTVDAVDINPITDDIDDVTKKVSIITTVNSLLNDSEKGFMQRITARLKNKESDVNLATGQLAVDILKRISLFDTTNHNVSVPSMAEQEEAFSRLNSELDDISTSECKTNYDDIPPLPE